MLEGRPQLRTPDGWRELPPTGRWSPSRAARRAAISSLNRTDGDGSLPGAEHQRRPRPRRLSGLGQAGCVRAAARTAAGCGPCSGCADTVDYHEGERYRAPAPEAGG